MSVLSLSLPSQTYTNTKDVSSKLLVVWASSQCSKYLNFMKFFSKEQISTGEEFKSVFLTLTTGESSRTLKTPECTSNLRYKLFLCVYLCMRARDKEGTRNSVIWGRLKQIKQAESWTQAWMSLRNNSDISMTGSFLLGCKLTVTLYWQ